MSLSNRKYLEIIISCSISEYLTDKGERSFADISNASTHSLTITTDTLGLASTLSRWGVSEFGLLKFSQAKQEEMKQDYKPQKESW